jgi:hypothetical protein
VDTRRRVGVTAPYECPGLRPGREGEKCMSKTRVVLPSLLAVLAASAISSSPSLAHEYLVEQKSLETSEAVEDQGQNSKLETKVSSLPLYIQCQEELSSGELKPKGVSKFRIEFKNCYFTFNSKGKKEFSTTCGVTEPVVAEGEDRLIEHSVEEFKGSEGIFTKIQIVGMQCALTGFMNVSGSQICVIPEAEFDKVLHQLSCTPAGSKLAFGNGEHTEPAQYFAEEQIRLKSLKPWGAT